MTGEDQNLEKFKNDLEKGLYPKNLVEEMRDELKGEVKEEKTEFQDILKFFKDQAMNKELTINPNTGKMDLLGFEGYCHLYLFNDSEEGSITNIEFIFEDKDLTVVECPQELKPKEMKPLVLRFSPSRPRALKTKMTYRYEAMFTPEED
jgi:hypothetical protein